MRGKGRNCKAVSAGVPTHLLVYIHVSSDRFDEKARAFVSRQGYRRGSL